MLSAWQVVSAQPEACRPLPNAPRVLDLGCGSGAQTLHLAELLNGSILAVDAHPPLIERLSRQVAERGLSGRVEARVGDMATLELPPASFDLVWSEAALYNMGLDAALPRCAALLRPGGYLAFTEAVWRTAHPSAEVKAAFADYPTMGRRRDVFDQLLSHFFSLIEHFDLPDEAWWDEFYAPMEQRVELLRGTYREDREALAILEEIAKEPEMHRRRSDEYGYTFFIARL